MVYIMLMAFSLSSYAQSYSLIPKIKIYSESLRSDDQPQNILSETRVRFHPFSEEALQPFVGAYKNPFNYGPTAGLIYSFGPQKQFQLLAEQRLVYNDKQSAISEGRYGLIVGDWREWKEKYFLETYGESILIPRIDKTPVSTLWTRIGYRAHLIPSLYLDPFLQLWTRASVSQDLGQSGTELRPGLRLLWVPSSSLAVGLIVYRRATVAPMTDKLWEGLFVIQGEL